MKVGKSMLRPWRTASGHYLARGGPTGILGVAWRVPSKNEYMDLYVLLPIPLNHVAALCVRLLRRLRRRP